MHEKLMKQLYAEYAAFKQEELEKEAEEIFRDAFQITSYEMILYHYERTLPTMSDIVFHMVCEKGLETDNLLHETHKQTLLDVHPIMNEEKFKTFLDNYFLAL